jgi:hypothetical protein
LGNTSDVISLASESFWRRKKTYIYALLLVGLIDAALLVAAKEQSSRMSGFQLLTIFGLNVAMLGWCYVDAEERKIPVSGWLRVVMLFVPIIGVPWYFIRSRGLIRAAKAAFGLGLFAIWFGSALISLIVMLLMKALFSL